MAPTFYERDTAPHLVSLAIQFSLRRVLRDLLRREHTKFIVVLNLTDGDDMFLYEEAAARLLGVYDDYEFADKEGKSFVTSSSSLGKRPWEIIDRLQKCRRAIVFNTKETELNDDIRLASDFEYDVAPPTAAHFACAARQLGFPLLKAKEAEFLASQPLRRIRVAMVKPRPYPRIIDSLSRQEESSLPVATGPTVSKLTLETLHGYGAAKEWGLQLATDLADWRNGRIEWEDVDKGIVLQGPPGCGKTMFAGALAASCGVNLISASAARWQSKGHLGDMLKAMRDFFAAAAKASPCIAFIDELDSFGDREQVGDDHHHADYKTQVINALLECLAPPEGRLGVVVVGATNNANRIDAALLRAGRFESVITIHLPDEPARLAIFRHHLSMTSDFDERRFLARTKQWSGAQLEKLARDARRFARRKGMAVVRGDDVFMVMPPEHPMSDSERYRLAVHEAGHALVTFALRPEILVSVRIASSLPVNSVMLELGDTVMKRPISPVGTENEFHQQIMILLGGMIAEKLVLGEHSTAAGGQVNSDLSKATRYATMMEKTFAFGQTLSSEWKLGEGDLERYRMSNASVRDAVEARLRSCWDRAAELLDDNRERLLGLASRLVEKGELGAFEVEEVVGTVAYHRVPQKRSSGGHRGSSK